MLNYTEEQAYVAWVAKRNNCKRSDVTRSMKEQESRVLFLREYYAYKDTVALMNKVVNHA